MCNNVGHWTAECSWPQVAESYREWSRVGDWEGEPYGVGGLQLVAVESQLWVANLVAQHGLPAADGTRTLRYGALETCLDKLQGRARLLKASLHLSRLRGCDWERIERLLRKMLSGLDVFVYEGD